jgi:diguanylate cyclase (GGDEF)-like protein
MTRYSSQSRLCRLWTSWFTLIGAVLALVAVGGALVLHMQSTAKTQTKAGAIGAGYLIAATTVAPGLARGPAGLDTKAIDASSNALFAEDGISGLSVWTADGHLLYHRGMPDRQGPTTPDFKAAARGQTPVQFFKPQQAGAESSLAVLIPFGAEKGPAPLVVGVTMPSGLIVDLTTWATVRLLMAIVVAGILAVIGVFALQRRLRRRSFEASHDSMTGLGNRSLLESAATKALRQDEASLLLMDLDGFKRVNDHLGHATGDLLLTEVANALRGTTRPDDILVRLGGDEFAVLLPGAHEAAARTAAQRLLNVVQGQFVVNGVTVEVDASIGIATAPQDGMTIGELLSAADIAMYRAKRDRLGVCTYLEAGPAGNSGDLALLVELRRAIPAGELTLHYQPAVATRPDAPEFMEALVRWQHPERGLVPPLDFIPLAEETALIHPLTEWVIEEAARQCAQWHREGLNVTVAVNVSPRSLVHVDLVDSVIQALARHQLPASALHIEVTESAIIARPETARQVLAQLQALGVSISIDDFGAGYTSLAHLRRMPVEVLKIDRTFIGEMLRDSSDQAIVSSVIELGHRLGMRVVAEGVEDQETLNALTLLGCDIVQGYHISRPQTAADTTTWLLGRSEPSLSRA